MSQSLLDLIATQDDEEVEAEAPAPTPEPVPEKKRSRARTDQRALVPEGTFSQSAVQKSEACADQAFGWRFVGGKRTWKAHDLPKPPNAKSQPRVCAAAAKRFGRQNQTSAALRCYAASLRAARDPALVGDVGVFAATDPQLLTATRDAFAAVAQWDGAPPHERTRCAALLYDLCPNDPTALVRAAEALSSERVRVEDRGARACLLSARAALLLVGAAAPTVAADARHPAQLDALVIALRTHSSQIRANATARDALDRARRGAARVELRGKPAEDVARAAAIATAVAVCADTVLLDDNAPAPSGDLALGTILVADLVENEGDGAALAAWLASDETAPQRLAAAGVRGDGSDIAEDAARLITDAGSTLFLRAAAMACVRKASDADWVALAEAVAAGIDTDGVEAARRAVFPERVKSQRVAAWFVQPKRKKKKRAPGDISDAARAAKTVVAALAATDDAEAFARATAADLRAAPAARPTTGLERHARAPVPRAGSRAEFEAALAREDGGGAVARFLRFTDRQLLWGQAAPTAAPAAPAPAPAPPKKKKQRRQGCDCAATGPHRRTCPLYRPPPPKPTSTEAGGFWAQESARRTAEVRGLYSGVEEPTRTSAAPKPKRAPSMKTCPACSLKVHNRRTTCPGCGAAFPKKTESHWSGGRWRPAVDVTASAAPPAPPPAAQPATVPPAAPPAAPGSKWTPDEDAALRRLHAEHSQTRSKWDVIAAAIGTRRTASAAEQRWLLIKNKSAPAPAAAVPPAAPPRKRRQDEWTPDEDAALRRLHAEHVETPFNDRGSLWDVIAAAMGTRRTASAAEQRWLLLKNKNAPAPAAAEPPAKKRKKSEKRVEKKKKKQRSRVWDLDKKKYVTS
jgi:hypothetical protein